ncbi:MAG: hypothetical protein U5L96_19760 [Owenweeksia sp.]|nr:hypothetical protein [Owenweeksia sp.]
MNWNGVNLERILKSERKKTEKKNPDEILAAFRRILADDDATDEQIAAQIFNGNNKGKPLSLSGYGSRAYLSY